MAAAVLMVAGGQARVSVLVVRKAAMNSLLIAAEHLSMAGREGVVSESACW